jgi:hypothetical protein
MLIDFHGCSQTEGEGLDTPQDRFSTLVGKYFDCAVRNFGVGGSSNTEIFVNACHTLLDEISTHIFVQWTVPGRQTIHSHYDIIHNTGNPTLRVNYIPPKNYKTFCDVYRLLDNEYNSYRLLNHYIPILNNIAILRHKDVYYINGGVYIDKFFLVQDTLKYIESEKIRRILNFDNLPDEDITNNLQEIRQFLSVINGKQWVNTTKSFKNLMVDICNDEIHPGVISHKLYAGMIINFLEEKGFV